MTTSQDLLLLVTAGIAAGNTDAEDRVYHPGDVPAQSARLPLIKARIIRETRVSISGSTAPEFTTTAVIAILGQVSEPAQVENGGATEAEAKLWALKRQIEIAVVNTYPLMRLIQNIPSIDSYLEYTSQSATHLAGIRVEISLEFYEGPENFAPIAADDIASIGIGINTLPPTGIEVDLQQ